MSAIPATKDQADPAWLDEKIDTDTEIHLLLGRGTRAGGGIRRRPTTPRPRKPARRGWDDDPA